LIEQDNCPANDTYQSNPNVGRFTSAAALIVVFRFKDEIQYITKVIERTRKQGRAPVFGLTFLTL
jgi:hypothetical protein